MGRVPGEITPISAAQYRTNDGNETYKANHSFDKDLSTFSIALVENSEVWLKLNLGETHFIHTITIYRFFYTDWNKKWGMEWCTKNFDNYKICKNSYSDTRVDVYQEQESQGQCGIIGRNYALDQVDQVSTLPCSLYGDEVLLYKTLGKINVCEIVIVGRGRGKS